MFRGADNLKQAIALAAILLSSSSLAQNAGMYCYLGACGTKSVASSVEQSSCCHHHPCHADEHPAAPCEAPVGHQSDSCPCPDSCWCHQAPQPYELPRSFDEPFELAFLETLAICNDVIGDGVADQAALVTWSLPPGLDDESVVSRCAKLCRFLI